MSEKQQRNSVIGRPFEKGKTGNPNGRPKKGYSITEAVQTMLGKDPKVKAAIVARIIQAAKKGDLTAIKMLWSYMDGMPTQQIENTGEITVRKVVANAGDSTEE